MIARASLVVALVGERSRCVEVRSDPPLTLRETATGVHLVASGAGPVGGDDLSLTIRVGAGAELDLRSVAASMAHPGPTGRPSHLAIEVEVGDGAALRWTPQPTILVRGCDHHVTTRVRLGRGATLVWREELVLGRSGEASGSILQRLLVDGADRPVLRNDLAIGPRWPGSQGPAGVGVARSAGTVLVVGPEGVVPVAPLPPVDGVRWAVSPLGDAGRVVGSGGHAALVTAIGSAVAPLAAALDLLTEPAPRPPTPSPTRSGATA